MLSPPSCRLWVFFVAVVDVVVVGDVVSAVGVVVSAVGVGVVVGVAVASVVGIFWCGGGDY